MSTPYDSTPDTLAHIARVQELMRVAQTKLLQRAAVHDASKLEEPEKSGYDICTVKLKDIPYGSPEYKAALEELRPTLDHHYAHNSHHPQFYSNGIDGMSLLDIIEMLIDWKASTERMKSGDIRKSLEINRDRFKISPQLESILANTIKEMGW